MEVQQKSLFPPALQGFHSRDNSFNNILCHALISLIWSLEFFHPLSFLWSSPGLYAYCDKAFSQTTLYPYFSFFNFFHFLRCSFFITKEFILPDQSLSDPIKWAIWQWMPLGCLKSSSPCHNAISYTWLPHLMQIKINHIIMFLMSPEGKSQNRGIETYSELLWRF